VYLSAFAMKREDRTYDEENVGLGAIISAAILLKCTHLCNRSSHINQETLDFPQSTFLLD
jgi:hypothetical protein